MYYSIIYEHNQKGYLLNTYSQKLPALELLQSILDDFSKNNYVLSNKVYKIENKFPLSRTYPILTHQKNIKSTESYKVVFMLELDNSFIYHIESTNEQLNVQELSRNDNESVQHISKQLNEEITINLN